MRIQALLTIVALASGCTSGMISSHPDGGSKGHPDSSLPVGDRQVLVGGPVGPTGGTVDLLQFAVIGDVRPGGINATSSYPTATITSIMQGIQSLSAQFARSARRLHGFGPDQTSK